MYIYEEGKKLVNLDHILVVRVHGYTPELDYVEFEGSQDTVATFPVPKGEGIYVLAGIRYILDIDSSGIYTIEELKEYGKSKIEGSD
jgi:hypothetical protein